MTGTTSELLRPFGQPAVASRPARRSCEDCMYFRIVKLKSGWQRLVCMFTGKLDPEPCDFFHEGKWEKLA